MATSGDEVVAVEPEDLTEPILRSWGLSGEPITWAASRQQPVIAAIRAANTGFGDLAMVQGMLDATYLDETYDAAKVTLAHPPAGTFTVVVDGLDVVCDLDDADLGLPVDVVRWNFGGDGAGQGGEWTYAAEGDYTVELIEMVAGVQYGSRQDVSVAPNELTPFDPGDHTVVEVKEYLAEHPEEIDAVIEAEADGKGRAGVLEL